MSGVYESRMFSSRTLDSSSSENLCFVSADDGDGLWKSKLCAKRAIVVGCDLLGRTMQMQMAVWGRWRCSRWDVIGGQARFERHSWNDVCTQQQQQQRQEQEELTSKDSEREREIGGDDIDNK